MRRASLLPAHLEIMLASGDLEEARRARDELRELADAFDTDVLRAVVAQADGAIAIAEGDPHAALDPLRCAFDIWKRFDAPYEAARVRVLIGARVSCARRRRGGRARARGGEDRLRTAGGTA